MSIKDVWHNVNITTLLILPLFNHVIKNIKTKKTPYVDISFFLLAYECGLINSYLFTEEDDSLDSIWVAFDQSVLENTSFTNSKYHSLNECIIDNDSFIKVIRQDDSVVYNLKLPGEFKSDIKLITEGKYSKVSDKYKSMIKFPKYYPKMDNVLANYILKNDIPYSILIKAKHLKQEMVDIVGPISNTQEFYLPFNHERETLSIVV